MLTVIIEGKEAIPVRAIPFVTGWLMSPDVVAKSLANTDTWISRLKDVTSYHLMRDGNYSSMLPKEWDCIEAELQVLSEKLKLTEAFDQENYPQWRRESIAILPASCFVWKEEFAQSFTRSYSPRKFTLIDERQGDRELNFTPRISHELISIVMDGFIPEENEGLKNHDEIKDKEMNRRNTQLETILAVIAALEYDPFKIPDGGKAKVKSACLTRPRLFTPASFDHAWKDGLSQSLFRLANHDKYSSNNQF